MLLLKFSMFFCWRRYERRFICKIWLIWIISKLSSFPPVPRSVLWLSWLTALGPPGIFSGRCISIESSLGPTLSLLFLLLGQSRENKWANLPVNTYMCNMQDIAWIYIYFNIFTTAHIMLPAFNEASNKIKRKWMHFSSWWCVLYNTKYSGLGPVASQYP